IPMRSASGRCGTSPHACASRLDLAALSLVESYRYRRATVILSAVTPWAVAPPLLVPAGHARHRLGVLAPEPRRRSGPADSPVALITPAHRRSDIPLARLDRRRQGGGRLMASRGRGRSRPLGRRSAWR